MNIDFDSMEFLELWKFRIEHQISIPTLGDLLAVDLVRIREREVVLKGPLPESELIHVPVGRMSFTVVTKVFADEFCEAMKAAVKEPQSPQEFEAWRKRILTSDFQELVLWNGLQNLLSTETLDRLFEKEEIRRLNNIPQTETIRRGAVAISWTEEHVADLRTELLAAVDQKEKDFSK